MASPPKKCSSINGGTIPVFAYSSFVMLAWGKKNAVQMSIEHTWTNDVTLMLLFLTAHPAFGVIMDKKT